MVTIPPFSIERTEVTNRQYELCVRAGICAMPAGNALDDPQASSLPVTSVTAQQAGRYCLWLGRHLPTYYEWEYAARGSEGRAWPWGSTPTATRVLPISSTSAQAYAAGSFPYDVSVEGVRDMAGNVSE
jgi:formylglycine-generating enzyme required for sulfatase activity